MLELTRHTINSQVDTGFGEVDMLQSIEDFLSELTPKLVVILTFDVHNEILVVIGG